MNVDIQPVSILTPAQLLAHWQGHRRLTRRVIEVFPEDQLFGYSAGSMRSFGKMAWESYGVTEYNLTGLVNDDWGEPKWDANPSQEKAVLLTAWDDLTARMDAQLPGVPPARYGEEKKLAWGNMPAFDATIYSIDNEIHHRGQGYVYLRLLGIEPPPFWER